MATAVGTPVVGLYATSNRHRTGPYFSQHLVVDKYPEAVQREARQAAIKKAGFLGLPPREREAIQQSLGEKYPQEYGAMVEQYLLNLANEPAKK